jgi:hypothetical protein
LSLFRRILPGENRDTASPVSTAMKAPSPRRIKTTRGIPGNATKVDVMDMGLTNGTASIIVTATLTGTPFFISPLITGIIAHSQRGKMRPMVRARMVCSTGLDGTIVFKCFSPIKIWIVDAIKEPARRKGRVSSIIARNIKSISFNIYYMKFWSLHHLFDLTHSIGNALSPVMHGSKTAITRKKIFPMRLFIKSYCPNIAR